MFRNIDSYSVFIVPRDPHQEGDINSDIEYCVLFCFVFEGNHMMMF